jgi:DNA primase
MKATLRQQVTIEQVLRRLGHWDCLRGSTTQRRGPCPVHGSSHAGSRSFSVNLEKNVFRCFCPECSAKGNVLDLWAAVQQLPLGEAAQHLAHTFGLHLDTRTREEEPVLPRIASAALAPQPPQRDNPTITNRLTLCPNIR